MKESELQMGRPNTRKLLEDILLAISMHHIVFANISAHILTFIVSPDYEHDRAFECVVRGRMLYERSAQ